MILIFSRRIILCPLIIFSVIVLFIIYNSPLLIADDIKAKNINKFNDRVINHVDIKANKKEDVKVSDNLKNKNNVNNEINDKYDSLLKCYDNMNKLIPKVKYNNRSVYLKYMDIERRIKRIEKALKNDGILFSADQTSEKMSFENLSEMLVKEKEALIEAGEKISFSSKELDAMISEAVLAGTASYEKAILCPENGVYSLSQDDRMRYKIRCSVHGSFEDVCKKLYERSMKTSVPLKFCRGNVSAIIGACEQYCIEYGAPREWNMDELIEEGFLQNECICPAGGIYTIKGDFVKNIKCSCSVHK